MNETTPVYKKVGRRYVPIAAQWYESDRGDQIAAGTFRLVYAHKDGCRRYEYAVTPATAPTVAAMMVARAAMEEAIRKACTMRPNTGTKYTKRQLALIEQFKRDMGMEYPSWWTESSSYEISEAAIAAVMEYRP